MCSFFVLLSSVPYSVPKCNGECSTSVVHQKRAFNRQSSTNTECSTFIVHQSRACNVGHAPTLRERASHICVDCGYVYTLPTPFGEQGKEYTCPQCSAPRSRFAKYDVETGKAIGNSSAPLITSAATVVGLAGIAYYVAQLL